MYAGGDSEKILGSMDNWKNKGAKMATKVNCWEGKNFGEESLRKQASNSHKIPDQYRCFSPL